LHEAQRASETAAQRAKIEVLKEQPQVNMQMVKVMEELASEADVLRVRNKELSSALGAITPQAIADSQDGPGGGDGPLQFDQELEAALAAREVAVQQLTTEKEELVDEVQQLVAEKEELEAQLEKADLAGEGPQDNERLKEELRSLEDALEAKHLELEESAEEVDRIQQELAELQERTTKAECLVEQLQKQLVGQQDGSTAGGLPGGDGGGLDNRMKQLSSRLAQGGALDRGRLADRLAGLREQAGLTGEEKGSEGDVETMDNNGIAGMPGAADMVDRAVQQRLEEEVRLLRDERDMVAKERDGLLGELEETRQRCQDTETMALRSQLWEAIGTPARRYADPETLPGDTELLEALSRQDDERREMRQQVTSLAESLQRTEQEAQKHEQDARRHEQESIALREELEAAAFREASASCKEEILSKVARFEELLEASQKSLAVIERTVGE